MIIKFKDSHGSFRWNLPLIVQYESYEWSPSCECPNARKDGYGYGYLARYDPIDAMDDGIVGYAETNMGIMLCHECPHCGTKWRCHPGVFKGREEFARHMGLLFFMDHRKQHRYDKFLVSEGR